MLLLVEERRRLDRQTPATAASFRTGVKHNREFNANYLPARSWSASAAAGALTFAPLIMKM